jgi:assimilatory nitrate reductase catalytic subunit
MHAIQRDGLHTVEALGQSLKAGTNCGSCIPELKELIGQCVKQCA